MSEVLRIPLPGRAVRELSWGMHRKYLGDKLTVRVDPGPTWATTALHYENLYAQLQPKRMPDLSFRELVRTDCSQEPLGWLQLFEDGAEAEVASPVLLDFPFHQLVDPKGRPLGPHYRAAFTGVIDTTRWILFPQITIQLVDGLMRPDGILLRLDKPRRWCAVQLDGGSHTNKKWDDKQDARLRIPTLRFPSSTILGLEFAQHFRKEVMGF